MPSASPPDQVLRAFGVEGAPLPVAGGQGDSWRCEGIILKPSLSGDFQQWLGVEVNAVLAGSGDLTWPEVVAAVDGRWTVDGWGAARFVDEARPMSARRDWRGVITAGRILHDRLSSLARPAFLDATTGAWAAADRAVWGEAEVAVHPRLAHVVNRSSAVLRRSPFPPGDPQVVHGDLAGNVLEVPDGPPVVIDLSPYWRQPAYAEGIVVADAITWHGADADLAAQLDVPPSAIARGLMFRILTSSEQYRDHADDEVLELEAERYADAVRTLGW